MSVFCMCIYFHADNFLLHVCMLYRRVRMHVFVYVFVCVCVLFGGVCVCVEVCRG